MKVSVEQSAGLVPIVTETTADTNDLEPEHATALRQKVRDSGIFDVDAPDAIPRPDESGVRLTVDDGVRQRTVVVTQGSMPDGVRSLVDWVSQVPGRKEEVHPIGGRGPEIPA